MAGTLQRRFVWVGIAMAMAMFCLSAAADEPTVIVRGRTISLEGSPVSGVEITLISNRHDDPTRTWTGMSNAQGQFQIAVPANIHGLGLKVDVPPKQRLAPFAVMPPSGLRIMVGSPSPLTILLAPATSSLGGTVLSEDGKPIAGAIVKLGTRAMYQSDFVARSAITDAAGKFEIDRMAAGSYMIRDVNPPTGSPWVCLSSWKGVRRFALSIGEKRREEFRLPVGARLTGRVLDENQKPVQGASVVAALEAATAEGPPSTYQKPGEWFRAHATTDADGRYVLGALTQETYRVCVKPPAGKFLAPAAVRGIDAPKTGNLAVQDVTLYKGGTLIATITDPDGKPVAGAKATVAISDDSGSGKVTATSDAQGKLSLAGLPTGKYEVTVQPPTGSPWCPKLTKDLTVIGGLSVGCKVQLPRGATLGGTVLDPAGKPVVGAGVRLRAGYSPIAAVATDAEGKFKLHGLAKPIQKSRRPSKWLLHVSPPPSARQLVPASIDMVPLPLGQTKLGVTVHMKAGVMISGRITDPDGKPVAGCRVTGTRKVGRHGMTWAGIAQTDKDGRYRLAHVSVGKWTMVAIPPAAVNLTPASLSAKGYSAGEAAVDITLKRGSTITGSVLDSKGTAVLGSQVRLVVKGGSRRPFALQLPGMGRGHPTAYSDGQGGFRFHGILPGEYRVECFPLGGRQRTVTKEIKISAVRDYPVKLTAQTTGTVRGTVLDASGKTPARNSVYLILQPGGKGQNYQRGYPDAQGRFEIKNVMPGQYSLKVKINNRGKELGMLAPPDSQISIKEGEQLKLDVKLREE